MRRGFSLVEMLIALALTAVALAIISEGVRQTINFEQRLAEVRQNREVELATLEAVRVRLERMVPAALPDEGGDRNEILFDGQAHSLVFLAADPGYPSAAGLYEYRLQIVEEESDVSGDGARQSPQLVVSRRSLTDLDRFNQVSPEDGRSWTLPLGQSMSFGYAAADSPPSRTWPETDAYPAIIVLEGENAHIPMMSVRLPRPPPEPEPDNGQEAAQ